MCRVVEELFDGEKFEVFGDVPCEATGRVGNKAKSRNTIGLGGREDLMEHMVRVILKKEFLAQV